ncbi:MAG: EamA family transporter [Sneathiella sp.]|nr:EamA family transporter [Sneathiella sp.]
MMSRLSPHMYGTLLTVLGVLVLTPDGLLVRLIGADAWTILFWRGIFFSIGILGFYAVRHRLNTLNIIRLMGFRGIQAAFFFASSTIFFVHAIHNTSVANVLVIIATAPLCSALISKIFLKENVSNSTWIAILISCGGIGFLFYGSMTGGNHLGDLYALGSAISIASQITTVRLSRHVDMVPSLGVSGVFFALFALPMASPFSVTSSDFSILLFLGLVILPIAFGLITIGPRYISATEVSLIMLLETFLGPIWVWLVIGETAEPETLIGGALVLTTLILHTLYNARLRARQPAV